MKLIKNPFFDELDSLAKEFPGTPMGEIKSSSNAEDQFNEQLNQLSVRQVEIKRENNLNDYFL